MQPLMVRCEYLPENFLASELGSGCGAVCITFKPGLRQAAVTHLLLVQIENLRHGFSSFIHLTIRIVGRRATTWLLLPAAIYYTLSYRYTNMWTIRSSKW
jgi:hypothetical protein